jgi:crotonobetainyl-CoA:carnitine CoA-transferase CaiB-like acyl-CoA transferase
VTTAPKDASRGLLAGVRVLDLSVWRPGPAATQLLAEIGAEVIKIEPPTGDPMRIYPDLFSSLNANKKSVALDLKDDVDRKRALDLAQQSDVIVEGFRPGVVARLGVGYNDVSALNPSVVYCSISGLGQTGPLSMASGHDLNFQAWAGLLAPEGGEPVSAAVPVADLATATTAAFAISAALFRRQHTGEGEYIDLAMADVLATWTGASAPKAVGSGDGPQHVPGYGIYETADGYVTLGVVNEDHLWGLLCRALTLPYAEVPFVERMARADELETVLRQVLSERQGQEVVETLLAAGVPVAPVNDRIAMLDHPHFIARGIAKADPWRNPATGYPVRFTHHPAQRTTPPPTIGQHSDAQFTARPTN